MTVASRAEAREALASLLSNSVEAAAEVHAHKAGDLAGKSPVLVVLSAKSGRPKLTNRGSRSEFFLEVHSFVLDALQDGSWTEAQAEDKLDEIEQQVAQAVANNQENGDWNTIDYEGETKIREVIIGGNAYLEEIIPIKVGLFR